MKKFELSLCESDFKKMEIELKQLSKKLSIAKEKILLELGKYTKERVQFYIKSSIDHPEYSTEKLYNSIVLSDIFNDTIKVYTENAYAKYVEYGTGIVGANNPHPYATESYKSSGWWYPIKEEEVPNYKGARQLKDGTWVVYTQGQKAHKFMYNAFQDLKANYLKISKEVLKKEGII